MEKVRKGVKTTPVQRVCLVRKAWANIIIFLLAGVIIGFGAYLIFQPEWIKRADIKLYNKGVSAYLLPSEILPATDERPSEFPIIRAAAYFQQAALESTDNRLKSLALYNLGTLMGVDALVFLSGDTPSFAVADGISKLGEAIRIDPNNEGAKYNLELLENFQVIVLQTSTRNIGAVSPFLESIINCSPGTVHKGY